MTIQPIGDTSAALYLSAADLEEHGVTGGELTLEHAMTLTQAAFARAGLTLAGSIEIEAFPDLGGVLVFVHLTPPQRRWVVFDSLDALLSALPLLPHEVGDAALYCHEERYFLSLPRQSEGCMLRLSEYGCSQSFTPVQEAALLEHAHPVAAGKTFDRFRVCFCS